MPQMLFIVVVFPAPFLPRRPTISPFRRDRETSNRMWLWP